MIQENITTPVSKNRGYILVIDDEDSIRSMFASYLENSGYQVDIAKDESEAKSLMSPEAPLLASVSPTRSG